MSEPSPLRSAVVAGEFPATADAPAFADAVADLVRRVTAAGGVVLHLQVVPGDRHPLGALARSHGQLWPLAGGATGTAAAVAACRRLGAGAFVVPWIEELDDASAAVVHHLVDDGTATLLGTAAAGRQLPAPIAALVVADVVAIVGLDDLVPASTGADARLADAGLTPREREILEYVEEGWRDREIADRLQLSVRTVEGHVMRARRKLGAADRTDLRR